MPLPHTKKAEPVRLLFISVRLHALFENPDHVFSAECVIAAAVGEHDARTVVFQLLRQKRKRVVAKVKYPLIHSVCEDWRGIFSSDATEIAQTTFRFSRDFCAK